jgi:preprotein translocase subunit YajC
VNVLNNVLTEFLGSPAMAAAPSQGGEGGGLLASLPFLLLMFLVMYFLVIRPQRRQADQHRKFLQALAKGDEVVTSGGIVGKVVGLADTQVTLEIAGNVKIKVLKGHIHKLPPERPETQAAPKAAVQ